MASQAENTTADAKADAVAEKAYARAADSASPKAAESAPKTDAKPATSKIDAAVADVKSTPKKAKRVARKAKPAAAKKAAAPRKASKKIAAKVKPAAKSAAPKPAQRAQRPISTVTKLKDRIMATTQTADFTKTVKETAAQAQTRAKAAYDRAQAYSGEMTDLAKGNVEALVESGKILGSGMQTMVRGEIEAAKSALETATADLKAVAAVRNPTDLFKLQGEIARRNFDALVAHYSKNAEVSLKLANDAFAPLSSRMSLAAERMSKAA